MEPVGTVRKAINPRWRWLAALAIAGLSGCTAIAGLAPSGGSGSDKMVRLQGYVALPGSLIGHNTGNLIGHNTGNLIGHNTGNYRILYDEGQRVANATATAYRWTSSQKSIVGAGATDGAGRYVINGLPSDTLCLLKASGNLTIEPMAVMRLDSGATQPLSLSGRGSFSDPNQLELKAPLIVNLASTLVAAKIQADALSNPGLLNTIGNAAIQELQRAVAYALTDAHVAEIATGTDFVTVFDQLSLEATVARAASALGLTLHPPAPSPVASSSASPPASPSLAPVQITPIIE